jgi:hypothetical protein
MSPKELSNKMMTNFRVRPRKFKRQRDLFVV